MNNSVETSIEHQESWDLIPWYVNSSLGDQDRERVTAHLRICAGCRDELAQQRRLFHAMSNASSIEHMPAASLKGLRQKLAEVDAQSPQSASDALEPQRAKRWGSQRVLLAASSAAVTVALGIGAVLFWNSAHDRSSGADYYTVTTATPLAQTAVIRAVFDPTLTMSQLQALLDESRLRIVAGPTEAGVYSLASTASQPVSSALQRLRSHATVRFAEATVPTSTPAAAP
jgi:Putative zinc-finger